MNHKNYEFKAKISNPDEIRQILKENRAIFKGTDLQTDTYYQAGNGRLKIREGNIENSIIYYDRKDAKESRESDIRLMQLTDPRSLKEVLDISVGRKVVVSKKREIYFIDNVKFHVDSLDELGNFCEVEAIDTNGKIGLNRIREQCDFYQRLLKVESSQIVSKSYSDMILEKRMNVFRDQAINFLDIVGSSKHLMSLKERESVPDHICFRVETIEKYLEYKSLLGHFGQLLISSQIGGREISTFKLYNGLRYKHGEIHIVELPAPKEGSKYSEGFEHCEFVTHCKLSEFIKKNDHVEFDTTSLKKTHNPEIKIKLAPGICVKFHEKSLAELISHEYLTSIES